MERELQILLYSFCFVFRSIHKKVKQKNRRTNKLRNLERTERMPSQIITYLTAILLFFTWLKKSNQKKVYRMNISFLFAFSWFSYRKTRHCRLPSVVAYPWRCPFFRLIQFHSQDEGLKCKYFCLQWGHSKIIYN